MLAIPAESRADSIWQNDVMMQLDGVGAFVRTLLPVRLSGGYTVTFGVWLGVHPEDLQNAFRVWHEPSYPELVLAGVVANDVQPWGLLARPATAVVRDADAIPYIDNSSDQLVTDVLRREWPHESVLSALPPLQ